MRSTISDFAVALLMCTVIVLELSEGEEVCYSLTPGEEDTCFNNDPPFDNAFGNLPDSPENIATKFFLYTRNGSEEQIYPNDLLSSANLRQRETKILIHGYMGGGGDGLMFAEADVLLEHGDYNVIGVDWSGGAQRLSYSQSVADTRLVGVQVGHLVNSLETAYQISPANVHIIGHSLGAQVAGYAGKTISGLGRISALDPAGPQFYENDPRVRICKTDAIFVDAIHTNGGSNLAEGLGLFDAVGHADFYVNGGRDQPGCISNFCSHLRAISFYTETIKQSCPFLSYPCESDLDCEDTCDERGCARAGFFSLQDNAIGLYSITTSAAAPFC